MFFSDNEPRPLLCFGDSQSTYLVYELSASGPARARRESRYYVCLSSSPPGDSHFRANKVNLQTWGHIGNQGHWFHISGQIWPPRPRLFVGCSGLRYHQKGPYKQYAHQYKSNWGHWFKIWGQIWPPRLVYRAIAICLGQVTPKEE